MANATEFEAEFDINMTNEPRKKTKKSSGKSRRPNLGLFAGFAIPVSIVAIVHMTIPGMMLAAFFGYLWMRMANGDEASSVDEAIDRLVPILGQDSTAKSSGNASFDAYREEMLQRLEQEQAAFEGFLERLRSAKDKSEFDDFMEDRATKARLNDDA